MSTEILAMRESASGNIVTLSRKGDHFFITFGRRVQDSQGQAGFNTSVEGIYTVDECADICHHFSHFVHKFITQGVV